jgi:hypothetical protein
LALGTMLTPTPRIVLSAYTDYSLTRSIGLSRYCFAITAIALL